MARNQRRVGTQNSPVLQAIPAACADEAAAVEFIEGLRWGQEPACPRCGDSDVAQMRDREGNRNKRFLWRCHGCKKQFTVRIGTIFEESRIPLRIWCHAFWRACSSKKGVSALQISRETGLTYKSALFMMHRIRFSMSDDPETPGKLSGTIEADETYVGGKPRYKRSKAEAAKARADRKPIVFAMLERGGRVRAMHIPRIHEGNLKAALRQHVDPSSRIITDEARYYVGIGESFPGGHETVKHRDGEYVRKGTDVTTNTVEGFFGLLKRGIYGTFHNVSEKHLHRYVAEFEFRYNTRGLDDGARTLAAIRRSEGKRLQHGAS